MSGMWFKTKLRKIYAFDNVRTEQISGRHEVKPRVGETFGLKIVVKRFLAEIESFHEILQLIQ